MPPFPTRALVAIAALVACAGGVSAYRDRVLERPPVEASSLALASPAVVTRLAVGYRALAADVYWIRAIQHYGTTKLQLASREAAGDHGGPPRASYAQLAPLLELTTSLDPYFNIAYRFGAIFLAEAHPGGAGRPDLAIALLEKGLRARPDKWEYMQDIGFVHYWWRHDYAEASRWFAKAGDVPGAPWFLRSLAATTLAEGGDRQSSRVMWQSIRESAEIEWLKNDAERRLMQLDALDFIATLQAKVSAWSAQSGRAPQAWDELIRARVVPGTPVDPTRVPYVLSADGLVALNPSSSLFPLPVEPQRLQ